MTQRGSATTELTLLTPLLLVLMLTVVLAGRVSSAQNALVGSVRDAARAATLRARADDARAAADAIASRSLAGARCRERATDVELEEDGAGHLVPGSLVTVTVRCEVALEDLALLAVPGTRHLQASATEVVDRFRGREG